MAFTPVQDVDGDAHQLWTQSQGCGCGPSCIAMIANKFGKSCDERWISGLITASERIPTVSSLAGQGHDFKTHGTFNVQAALRHLNVTSAYTDKTGHYKRAFQRCTKARPGMAWLQWQRWTQPQGPNGPVQWHDDPNGGTHWVVILGTATSDAGRYIVLDPLPNHGVSAQSYGALPYYTAPNGSRGKFRSWNENGVVTTA